MLWSTLFLPIHSVFKCLSVALIFGYVCFILIYIQFFFGISQFQLSFTTFFYYYFVIKLTAWTVLKQRRQSCVTCFKAHPWLWWIIHTPSIMCDSGSHWSHWVWPFTSSMEAAEIQLTLQVFENYLIIHSVGLLRAPHTSSVIPPLPYTTFYLTPHLHYDRQYGRPEPHTHRAERLCPASFTSTHLPHTYWHIGTSGQKHSHPHTHTHTTANRKWCGHADWDNGSRSVCSESKGTLATTKVSLQFKISVRWIYITVGTICKFRSISS